MHNTAGNILLWSLASSMAAVILVWLYTRPARQSLSPLLSIVNGTIPDFSENIGVATLNGNWRGERVTIEMSVPTGGQDGLLSLYLQRPCNIPLVRVFPREENGFIIMSQPEEGFLPWPEFKIKISDKELLTQTFSTPEQKHLRDFFTPRRIGLIRSIFNQHCNLIELSSDHIKVGAALHNASDRENGFSRHNLNPQLIGLLLLDMNSLYLG